MKFKSPGIYYSRKTQRSVFKPLESGSGSNGNIENLVDFRDVDNLEYIKTQSYGSIRPGEDNRLEYGQFSEDGTDFYLAYPTDNTNAFRVLRKHSLDEPFVGVPSVVSDESMGFLVSTNRGQIASDGSFFIAERSNDLFCIKTSSPFVMSNPEFQTSSGTPSPRNGVWMDSDGLRVLCASNIDLTVYSLTTPYDLTTLQYQSKFQLFNYSDISDHKGIIASPDKSRVYVLAKSPAGRVLIQFLITDPLDLTTAVEEKRVVLGNVPSSWNNVICSHNMEYFAVTDAFSDGYRLYKWN